MAEFLPLDAMNWITCGNALRIDWRSICPPTGTGVKHRAYDLFHTPLGQAEIDFENEGGETYICGNPPYRGSQGQNAEQKADLKSVFEGRTKKWKSLDYVTGWFMKAAEYGVHTTAASAFVSTNSICQGRQVETFWPLIFETGHRIPFAHTSFKWTNLASHNAGVTVAIIGLSNNQGPVRKLFSIGTLGETTVRETGNINPYLVSGPDVLVRPARKPIVDLPEMSFGNMPNEGGHLLLNLSEEQDAIERHGVDRRFIRSFVGSQEFISGTERRCIWVTDEDCLQAVDNEWLATRFNAVRVQRAASDRSTTKQLAERPHRFGEVRQSGSETAIVVPRHSSESREYLPVGYMAPGTIIGDSSLALYDAPLWNMALIASRLNLVWVATVCGKLETRYRYSNTLGWNTFPVPTLTDKNKADLTRCAEDILLARETYFPAAIADLYDPDSMPDDLRTAHDRNDEVLERIYVGRRFKNDTERLEKLFEMYTAMSGNRTAV